MQLRQNLFSYMIAKKIFCNPRNLSVIVFISFFVYQIVHNLCQIFQNI